jgi:hypothetical protein
MTTADMIRSIAETGKANVVEPGDRIEMMEAGVASVVVACNALGEILDELTAQVGQLGQRGAENMELSTQLAEIKVQLVKVKKALRKAKGKKKAKK